jgi:peptidoglycan/xylan/chitin deacetylase (PgdA/CDA1 family)
MPRWPSQPLAPALAAVLALSACAPGTAPTRPSTWKSGAVAAVSITMDDGYASQIRFMAPLLSSRGYAGTFFVVTNWLDAEDQWDAWRGIAADGHEIGSHGLTHETPDGIDSEVLVEHLRRARERIRRMLGPEGGRTYAYPHSVTSGAAVEAAARAGYEAARTGGNDLNPPRPPDLHRILSLHPLPATTLPEMNRWVDDVRVSGGWLVVGVHGIMDPDRRMTPAQEGWEPVPLERYTGLVDHIAAASGDLWVAPFGEAARYIAAREAVVVESSVLSGGVARIVIGGPEGGPALTFETEVPDDWAMAAVSAGDGEARVLQTFLDTGVRRVRYDATPPVVVTLRPAALMVGR